MVNAAEFDRKGCRRAFEQKWFVSGSDVARLRCKAPERAGLRIPPFGLLEAQRGDANDFFDSVKIRGEFAGSSLSGDDFWPA